jgi:hypothetical protein
MAIIQNEGTTYTPALGTNLGIDLTGSTFYGVIDELMYNKREKELSFSLDIYGTKSARGMENPVVVDRLNFHYNKEQFDENVGSNGISIAGAYALALAAPALADWKSDE